MTTNASPSEAPDGAAPAHGADAPQGAAAPAPAAGRGGLEVAILGGGCFWCLEAVYDDIEGVSHVHSGYAGGHVPNPSYEQVCGKRTGHAEVVRIAFDPARVSYRQLLEVFFVIHDPTTPDRQGADVGPQYRSAIFATTEAQLATAREVVDELSRSAAFDAPVVTQVQMLGEGAATFWPAEPEHDDYFARHPWQGYCMAVVAPKLEKFRRTFAGLRRKA